MLLYSRAKYSCHTPSSKLCNVVYIILQHLAWSVTKHTVAIWICFAWFDRTVLRRNLCQTPNLFQAFLCTVWYHTQQNINLHFATIKGSFCLQIGLSIILLFLPRSPPLDLKDTLVTCHSFPQPQWVIIFFLLNFFQPLQSHWARIHYSSKPDEYKSVT